MVFTSSQNGTDQNGSEKRKIYSDHCLSLQGRDFLLKKHADLLRLFL
jgi:hypothetical protein